MQSQNQIRQQITQQIITALEQDLVPWRKPWSISKNSGRPANVHSKRPYSGINPLLLELHALEHSFQSRWWGTFDQWKKLGGTVKKRPSHVAKGEWGCKIVFYKPVSKKTIDPATGEEDEDKFLVMRTWSVFNSEQIEGEAIECFKTIEQPQAGEFPDFQPAQQLIDATGADVRFGSDQAFYRRPMPDGSWPEHRDGDYIVLPHRHQFIQPGAFYEVAFHELSHWSEVRLGWNFEKHGYEMGELVAEMSACFLAQEVAIPNGESLGNHAMYIKDWLKAMRGDPAFIFKASTQASKVSDFLLSFVRPPTTEPEPIVLGSELEPVEPLSCTQTS
jgi:antirestriction protein ArdC